MTGDNAPIAPAILFAVALLATGVAAPAIMFDTAREYHRLVAMRAAPAEKPGPH